MLPEILVPVKRPTPVTQKARPMLSAILALAAQSTFTVTNATYAGPVRRPAGARMVWSDEFNGRTLDLRKWRYETAFNKKGWFNKELQYYSAGWPGNLRLRNGRPDHRSAARDAIQSARLGRAALHLGPDRLEGARLDLWLLRSARQTALRARHLAGDLDASGRHEEMARRRRDRHHGAGRRPSRTSSTPRSTPACSTMC